MIRNVIIQIGEVLGTFPGMAPGSLALDEYFVGYIMGIGNIIGTLCGLGKPIERVRITGQVMEGILGPEIKAAEVIALAASKNKEARILERAAEDAVADFSEFFRKLEADQKTNKPAEQTYKEFAGGGLPRLKRHITN